jgi:uncharacterized protein (TIGR03437 family)
MAIFNGIEGVVSDSQGNLYVADTGNNRIRRIDTNGVVTTIAGTGAIGFSGDFGPATAAALNLKHTAPFASNLTIDAGGNLYISDFGNGRIRKIDTSGVITTVAGGGPMPIARGGIATSASIQPGPLAVDPSGNIYFGNVLTTGAAAIPTIYKIDAYGQLSPFAGGAGKVSDGGPALTTPIGYAYCLAPDNSGSVFICDSAYNRVRKVSNGSMTTAVGNGNVPSGAIQPGPATATAIGSPLAAAVDAKGNLFVASLRQVTMTGANGLLELIAGGNAGPVSAGDGSDASQASFTGISAITADSSGKLYLTDGGTYIREAIPVGPDGLPPMISTGGIVGGGASNPPVQTISPGGIASVFGANFVAPDSPGVLAATDPVAGNLPTVVAGVCVSFGGTSAPIMGVFPNQINVQIPALPVGPVAVKVTANCGAPNPISGNVSAVSVAGASPELFSAADPLSGLSLVTAINVAGGPITPGATIEAYGTGWGATNPAIPPGAIPGVAAQLTTAPSLSIGGVTIPAANILYAGVSPCCAGLYQIDFTLPAETGTGNLPLVINLNGVSSPGNVYLPVQQQ